MSRRVIDERDALRRTVARQDERIRELESELRSHKAAIEGLQAERDRYKNAVEGLSRVVLSTENERDEYKRAAEHYVPVAHALAAAVRSMGLTVELERMEEEHIEDALIRRYEQRRMNDEV
jgi:DNA repair ATPase RecN